MKLSWVVGALGMLPLTLNAQAVTPGQVASLCNFVAGKTSDVEGARFMFAYEEHLWKMAGADLQVDSDSVAKAKIRRMWATNRAALYCHTTTMSGDVLAVAVRSTFPEFIEALFYEYDIDLNYIDVDRRTVLDFIDLEISRLAALGLGNSEAVAALRGYYRTFREDLGIKHARELGRQ